MNLRFVEGLMLRQAQHERQNWRASTRPSTSSGRTEVEGGIPEVKTERP